MLKTIKYTVSLLICLNLVLAPFFIIAPVLADGGIACIGAAEALDAVKQYDALMVCSYADSRCQKILFQGALLRSEFEARSPSID